MNNTITVTESEAMDLAYCSICKGCKGHYTHQHDDWVKLEVEDE